MFDEPLSEGAKLLLTVGYVGAFAGCIFLGVYFKDIVNYFKMNKRPSSNA